jgi:hypothetical protein
MLAVNLSVLTFRQHDSHVLEIKLRDWRLKHRKNYARRLVRVTPAEEYEGRNTRRGHTSEEASPARIGMRRTQEETYTMPILIYAPGLKNGAIAPAPLLSMLKYGPRFPHLDWEGRQ